MTAKAKFAVGTTAAAVYFMLSNFIFCLLLSGRSPSASLVRLFTYWVFPAVFIIVCTVFRSGTIKSFFSEFAGTPSKSIFAFLRQKGVLSFAICYAVYLAAVFFLLNRLYIGSDGYLLLPFATAPVYMTDGETAEISSNWLTFTFEMQLPEVQLLWITLPVFGILAAIPKDRE
ncbi:MAG: hypothetical protein J5999_05715 [Oscillospiraceae bacterium]|nr:hypothetical protein [Oscillospiraceae bacterium]